MLERRHLLWLAENLFREVDDAILIDALLREGLARDAIEAAIASIVESPIFDAALPVVDDARRFQRFVRRTDRLARDAANPRRIDERDAIAPDEFFDHYYAHGIPLVLRGFASGWPAIERWTRAGLTERLGGEAIVVAIASDDELDVTTQRYRRTRSVRFSDYLTALDTPAPENRDYLVAGNFAFDGPLGPMLDDLSPPRAIIDRLTRRASLFLGPAGTKTRYHHDDGNALVVQIVGRKRWSLIAPTDPVLLDAIPGSCSLFFPESPELGAALQRHVELGPGDALFVPTGTFHHVESLSIAASISLTGFPRDNDHWLVGDR